MISDEWVNESKGQVSLLLPVHLGSVLQTSQVLLAHVHPFDLPPAFVYVLSADFFNQT